MKVVDQISALNHKQKIEEDEGYDHTTIAGLTSSSGDRGSSTLQRRVRGGGIGSASSASSSFLSSSCDDQRRQQAKCLTSYARMDDNDGASPIRRHL